MGKLEVGKSYSTEDLNKICGVEEGERYEHYVFVGENATVIALDEGNDVVKVVEIIRQTPRCPYCHEAIEVIYTSRTVHIVRKNDKWAEEQADRHCTYQCPVCYEEFGADDLDKLGVPNEIR